MVVAQKAKLSVIGHSVKRVDVEEKVRGEVKYGVDYKIPNMYVGKILRSPHAHALIRKIHTAEAENIKGVVAVITAADLPEKKYGVVKEDETVFARDKVRFQGEEVCGVVAVDEETADRALKAIRVEYEILEHVTDPLEAMKKGAPIIHEEHPDNICLSYTIERGDVEKAFKDAFLVVKGRYEFPMSHQAHIEPLAAIAEMVGNRLVVHAAAQEPFFTRREIAHCLDLSETDVSIDVLMAGGGFGARCDQKLPIVVAAMAWKAGVPVKVVNSREEEMASGRPLMPAIVDAELALDENGYFLGKKANIIAENGAYTSIAPAMLSVASTRADSLYRYQSVFAKSFLVYTNKPVSAAYRGFGNQQIHFPMESLIDEAAVALNMDPLELRLLNASQEGDVSIHGWELKSCGLAKCLQKVQEKYNELKAKHRESPDSTKKRGLGVAALMHVSGNRTTHPAFGGSSAVVKVFHNGKVHVLSGEACVGQGVHTVFAQIAAEELGLLPSEIKVILGNTDETPFALGCHASRVTTLGGNAVLRASRNAAKQLKEAAAELLGGEPEDFELHDHRVCNRLHGRSVSFTEAAYHAVLAKQSGIPIIALGVYEPAIEMPDRETQYGNLSAAYPFGAHLVEVEVDLETGATDIKQVFAVHDSGKVINPVMIEGQVEGGVVQGIGSTLFEEMIYQDGVLKNNNFVDYKIPTIQDIPSIELCFVETDDPEGPYGAKGVGETPLLPVAPAVSNAIFAATGVRPRKVPFTAQRLHAQLEKEIETSK